MNSPPGPTRAESQAPVAGEPRWPMLCAVLVAIAITAILPKDVRAGPPWLLPGLLGLTLVALIVGDPRRAGSDSPVVRAVEVALIALLAFDALWATTWLVRELIDGGRITQSANNLLGAGSLVWVSNVIAFSLLYWELDDGGPHERVKHLRSHPDLAFPQELSPHLARPGWRPLYFDYLYLGFTAATAFSPTDVMPLARWAKFAMALQSLTSLLVVALVISRAVNVLK